MTARGYYALLALGSAAFTLVGSLVPFEFQALPWADATAAFSRAMTGRLKIESKSDAIANLMLGLPLGFALLGVLCADRGVPRRRAAALGLALLPGCMAFSAGVEFAQLYAPGRTCSGLDVLTQTLGAALGMAGWLVLGQRLTDEVRKATTGSGAAARFLAAYVLLLGFTQALPLDLSASPADAYRKFRDGGVKPLPFGECRKLTGDAAMERVSTLLALAGLYLPAGLLAAAIPGRFWDRANGWRVLLAALGLALFMELGQVLVKSRTTSATDVLVGGGAAFLGWRVGRATRDGTPGLALGVAWWAALVWVSWAPFAVRDPVPFDWIPGMPLEGGNPLWALEAMLTKLVLFGLLGVLVCWRFEGVKTRVPLVATVLGVFTSAFFEAGQTWFAGHTPCVTDVLLGGLGAFCGAWVAEKVMTPSPPTAVGGSA